MELLVMLSALAIAAPFVQQIFESGRERRLKKDLFTGGRMPESQCPCMQGLSRKQVKTILNELFVLGKGGPTKDLVSSIFRIVEQGMPEMLKMHPYLMGASGFQGALHQVHVTQPFQHPEVRHRLLALVAIGEDMHLFPVFRVSSNMSGDGAGIFLQVAPYKCPVGPSGGLVEKLAGQPV